MTNVIIWLATFHNASTVHVVQKGSQQTNHICHINHLLVKGNTMLNLHDHTEYCDVYSYMLN